MPTPVFHAGFEGTASVNGTVLNIDKWSFTEETNENGVTTTADYDSGTGRCYENVIGGITSGKFSIEFPYDSLVDPWPGLQSGTFLTNVVLTKTTGHTITMARAYVNSLAFDQGGVGGVQKVTLAGRNKGPFVVT